MMSEIYKLHEHYNDIGAGGTRKYTGHSSGIISTTQYAITREAQNFSCYFITLPTAV